MDYNQLIREAQEELDSYDLPETLQSRLEMILTTFSDLREGHEYSYWTGFSLVLSDINSEIYHNFQRIAEKLHISTGTLLTKLMNHSLKSESLGEPSEFLRSLYRPHGIDINHHKTVEVTVEDLNTIDRVHFSHIKKLVFSEDIPEDIFIDKVATISHCHHVVLPDHLSRLVALTKIRFCTEIQFGQENAEATTQSE